jgi:hypothetical protein
MVSVSRGIFQFQLRIGIIQDPQIINMASDIASNVITNMAANNPIDATLSMSQIMAREIAHQNRNPFIHQMY